MSKATLSSDIRGGAASDMLCGAERDIRLRRVICFASQNVEVAFLALLEKRSHSDK